MTYLVYYKKIWKDTTNFIRQNRQTILITILEYKKNFDENDLLSKTLYGVYNMVETEPLV